MEEEKKELNSESTSLTDNANLSLEGQGLEKESLAAAGQQTGQGGTPLTGEVNQDTTEQTTKKRRGKTLAEGRKPGSGRKFGVVFKPYTTGDILWYKPKEDSEMRVKATVKEIVSETAQNDGTTAQVLKIQYGKRPVHELNVTRTIKVK